MPDASPRLSGFAHECLARFIDTTVFGLTGVMFAVAAHSAYRIVTGNPQAGWQLADGSYLNPTFWLPVSLVLLVVLLVLCDWRVGRLYDKYLKEETN